MVVKHGHAQKLQMQIAFNIMAAICIVYIIPDFILNIPIYLIPQMSFFLSVCGRHVNLSHRHRPTDPWQMLISSMATTFIESLPV